MRILISNDDGIEAEGLHALVDVLAKDHEVMICAPMREQSGMAHALNVRRELEVVRRKMSIQAERIWRNITV